MAEKSEKTSKNVKKIIEAQKITRAKITTFLVKYSFNITGLLEIHKSYSKLKIQYAN